MPELTFISSDPFGKPKVSDRKLIRSSCILATFNEDVTYRFQDSVSFEPHQTVNMTWLLEDEAYLHSVLLVASAMLEGGSGSSPSRRELKQSTRSVDYLNKTLASLREGLSSTTAAATLIAEGHQAPTSTSFSLRDSRISVVATLAILSANVGDSRALRAHMAGLAQMVRLRGGMRSLRKGNPTLYAKIRRVDVLWALYSGEAPIFLTTTTASYQYGKPPLSILPGLYGHHQHVDRHQLLSPFGIPTFASALAGPRPVGSSSRSSFRNPLPPSLPPPRKNTTEHLIGNDHRLLAIFRAQQAASRNMNAALSAGRPLAEVDLRVLVAEWQGALMALRGQCTTVAAECLRLALLVVLTTAMNLPSSAETTGHLHHHHTEKGQPANDQGRLPSSPQRYPGLAQEFEACIRSLEISLPPSASSFPSPPSSSPGDDEVAEATAENDVFEEEQDDDDDLEADFMLWLLLVGAVSLYGVDGAWLRKLWRCHVLPRKSSDLTCWEHVARRLRRRWVWVDAVHDRLGRHAFEVLTFGRKQQQTSGDEDTEGGGGDAKRSEVIESPKGILWASGWAICPFRL
ncbi:uncharacterized protein PG998_010728 [Apiospora kogelbergensis]|uniref:uncharacterized protein n=1 Tax=Apiospora kogelbergensis TaxID=1337665 RepID=UPI003131D5EF